jgi:hypothetical protein
MNEMQSFKEERNFITKSKQKLKNVSKIVSQCLKKHRAANCSNDTLVEISPCSMFRPNEIKNELPK